MKCHFASSAGVPALAIRGDFRSAPAVLFFEQKCLMGEERIFQLSRHRRGGTLSRM